MQSVVVRTLFILVLLPSSLTLLMAQEIAFTFDDAPMGNSPLFSNAERTEKIISHLKAHKINAAFFVITGNIAPETANQLFAYTHNGHVLANHSHSHFSPSRVSIQKYLKDIQIADTILKTFDHTRPWYRYPYLNEGLTIGKRDSIRTLLEKLRLRNAYVTVDNYDWFINGELHKAVKNNQSVDYENLKDFYIDHIYQSMLFYDRLAQRILGRSPRHVLLLHENDLTALYLGDLITHIKSKGWKIITPEQAYQDEIASNVPDVVFNGQGRISAIAYAKGMNPSELVQDSEDESFLQNLLVAKKIFK